MKKGNAIPNGRLLLMLVLTIVGLYAFMPRPSAQSCPGCYGASVTAGGVTWTDPNLGYPDPAPPTISTNCVGDGILVSGGAFIGDAPCQTYAATTNVIIDPGSTQAQVDEINSGGIHAYWVHNAKQVGSIKIEVKLSGNVTNCAGGCIPKNLDAVGSINVIGCGGCGCFGNQDTPSPSTGSVDNNSIDFKLYFGATSPRFSKGWLWLKKDAATSNLADPALLKVPLFDPAVEIITNSLGTIEQVNTPQMLVNVRTINGYEYYLECFFETNVTSKVGGRYGTNAPAFATWVIQNPDGAAAYNRLWITENRGGSSKQFQYTYTAANMQWDLLEPNGQTLSTWRVPDPMDVNITNYYRQIAVGSELFSKDVQTFQYAAAIGQKLLLKDINGFGSVTQTTTYSYYTNGPASNRIQEVIYPDGNWSYFTYDSLARKIRQYSAYENSPAPTPGIEPNPTNDYCKITQYDYALTNAIDGIDDSGDPYNPWVERKTTVYLSGASGVHEIERTYRWTVTYQNQGLYSDEREQCPTPGAPYGDPGNIKTTTYYVYGTGFADGQISQILHPDGSSTSFSYPDPFTTIEYDPDGSTTTGVVDAFGNPQSTVKTDDGTGVTLSQTLYRYTNALGTLYDPLMRTHDEIDLAGRTTHYDYDCCTLESIMGPDGISTNYYYDALKRRVATTVYYGNGLGVTISNMLDAVGNILSVTRIGTNNSAMVLQQYAYDPVGRVIAQTNALGGVTITTNVLVGGQLCTTNINPDGGTRVTMHYLDGSTQSITGTAVHGIEYTNDVEQDPDTGYWRQVTTETKVDPNGNPTLEWTKVFADGCGHRYLTLYAAASGPYPSARSFYNANGNLWKTVDPDGVVNFFIYYDNYYWNPGDINQGECAYNIRALSPTTQGISDYSTLVGSLSSIEAGIDQVTFQHKSIVAANSGIPDLIEMSTFQWTNNETDGNGTLVLSNAISTTGLTNWIVKFCDTGTPATSEDQTVYSAFGDGHSITRIVPDGTYSIDAYSYGRLSSMTRYDSNGVQVCQTNYTYDAHGRLFQTIDARNGATSYGYNNADLISSTTTPSPGSGSAAQVTTVYYNQMLQPTNTSFSDGTSVTNVYCLSGEIQQTFGSRTYPVGYSYDYAGRTKTLTNWQSFPNSGVEVTSWNYDVYRGFTSRKTYAGGTSGPSYTYTLAGRLASRTWARGITTVYNYDAAGSLTNISYSDGVTSSVTNLYDRMGMIIESGTADLLCQYSYDLAGELLVETNSAGILAGLAVTNGYDHLRRTNLTALGSGVLSQTDYGYDAASRLATVSDGTNGVTYTYLVNSPLVSQIIFQSNTVVRMTATEQYDFLNRLVQISNLPALASMVAFKYTYNGANQRAQDTRADGSYWVYQYDALGQVKSGKSYWRDGAPVAGQQFEYSFDDIGNRTQTKSGGDENGANLRIANYNDNPLNQITSRDVPGYLDILGIALATNTVTVNGQAVYRKGEYFRKELSVNNSSGALWTNINASSPGQSSVIGNRFVPATPETFAYDADGNLTNDGRWTYTWNAENQLIKMTINTNVGPQYQLIFTYDAKGRRIQSSVSTNGVGISTNRFLYDRWDLIVRVPNNAPLQTYVWGADLSGSVGGGAGAGGLLMLRTGSTNDFVGCDGNGNVVLLVDSAGVTRANYEYGPFGEVIRSAGPMASANPFRFSTRYEDDETELLYYGHRYYNASTGRWLNRDPLGEPGFENLQYSRSTIVPRRRVNILSGLYRILNNQPISFLDVLGLQMYPCAIGSVPVDRSETSWRKTSMEFSWLGFILPGNPNEYVEDIEQLWDSIEQAEGLVGEEYLHTHDPECVCAGSVSTSDWSVHKDHTDFDMVDAVTAEITIYFHITTKYDWHCPEVTPPGCINCSQNAPPNP